MHLWRCTLINIPLSPFKNKKKHMITRESTKEELFNTINETVSDLLELYSPLDNNKINEVPYANSWTASQLLNHITKSTNGISKSIVIKGKLAERDTTERVPALKNTFLDFLNKMQSPVEIVPDKGPYEKNDVVAHLKSAFAELKTNADNTDLNELVEGLPLGPCTKLELLHFVLYHSIRHLDQMKRICSALSNN